MSSFVAKMAARRKAQLTDHQLTDDCVAVVNAAGEAIADLQKAAAEEKELEFGPPPVEARPSVAKPSAPPPPPMPPIPAPAAAAAPAPGADGDTVADATAEKPAEANDETPAEVKPETPDTADDDAAAPAAPSPTAEDAAATDNNVTGNGETPAKGAEPQENNGDGATTTTEEDPVVTAAKAEMEKRIKVLLKWYRAEGIETLSGVDGVPMNEDLVGGVVATGAIAQYCLDHPVEGVAGPTSVKDEVAATLAEAYGVKADAMPRWKQWVAHILEVAEGKTLAKEPAAAAPVAQAAPAAAVPQAAAPPAAAVAQPERLTVGQIIVKLTALPNYPGDPLQENKCGIAPHRLRDLQLSQGVQKHLGFWLKVLRKPYSVEQVVAELGMPHNRQSGEHVVTFMVNAPRVTEFAPFRRRPNRLVSEVHPDLPAAWNVSTRVAVPISIDAREKFWCIVCTDLDGHPLGVSPAALPSAAEAMRSFMDNFDKAPWMSQAVSAYIVAPSELDGCSPRLMTFQDRETPEKGEEGAAQNRIVRRLAGPAMRLVEQMRRYRYDASYLHELNKVTYANAVRTLAIVVGMNNMA